MKTALISCHHKSDPDINLTHSERLRDTKSTGDMLKETSNINRSLFALGKVRPPLPGFEV